MFVDLGLLAALNYLDFAFQFVIEPTIEPECHPTEAVSQYRHRHQ